MGTEASCCAPSKTPLNLTEQLTGNPLSRKKDPFANLEGYIPVGDSEQDLTATYQGSLISTDVADQTRKPVTEIPSTFPLERPHEKPFWQDTDGEASYISKEEPFGNAQSIPNSRTQPQNWRQQRQTIVINYAEHVKNQRPSYDIQYSGLRTHSQMSESEASVNVRVCDSPKNNQTSMRKGSWANYRNLNQIPAEIQQQNVQQQKPQLNLDEGLFDQQEMVFDNAGVPTKHLEQTSQLRKENLDDSLASIVQDSRLVVKENLELVWQKANSISGIRKLNIQFKEERRLVKALDEYGQIQPDYWELCESFIQTMVAKQRANLMKLAQTDQPDKLMANIKNEIDFLTHAYIGLGRRMPVPESLNLPTARHYKQQLFDRVVEIYGRNPMYASRNELLHMVSTCAADDEFYSQTKLESEQIEIYLYEKEGVAQVEQEEEVRKPSYDYMQVMVRTQSEEKLEEIDDKSVNTDGAVEDVEENHLTILAQREGKYLAQSMIDAHPFDRLQEQKPQRVSEPVVEHQEVKVIEVLEPVKAYQERPNLDVEQVQTSESTPTARAPLLILEHVYPFDKDPYDDQINQPLWHKKGEPSLKNRNNEKQDKKTSATYLHYNN